MGAWWDEHEHERDSETAENESNPLRHARDGRYERESRMPRCLEKRESEGEAKKRNKTSDWRICCIE